MTTPFFRAGGPLGPDDASIYVEREGDRQAVKHLLQNNYVSVIEPRQQGKTSLVAHLMHHPGLGGRKMIYLDLSDFDNRTEPAWYQTLCERIREQLARIDLVLPLGPDPQNSYDWRDFLLQIARLVQANNQYLMIALDEVSTAGFAHYSRFFIVLREIFNSRLTNPEFCRLSFLLVGGFDPSELIADPYISPFNISMNVRLADFTVAEIAHLLTACHWPPDRVEAVAKSIHAWTGGQPFLTQTIASLLPLDCTPDDVDGAVERFRREDRAHLPRVITRLDKNPDLLEYVRRVHAGHRIEFYPSQYPIQAKLELLGILKAGQDGHCALRNLIYALALQPQLSPPSTPVTSPLPPRPDPRYEYDVFVSYSDADQAWVDNQLVPRLEKNGLRALLPRRGFVPGIAHSDNIERAINTSRRTVLVLTPHWLASDWGKLHMYILQTADPVNQGRRILPVLLKPTTLPSHLKIFTYLDLTGADDLEFQMERLVKTLQSDPLVPVAANIAVGFRLGRGLASLRQQLPVDDKESRLYLGALESRLAENIEAEQKSGSTTALLADRTRIIEELNGLAQDKLNSTFDRFCTA